MSPYLFIISMDPLARMLELERKSGNIRGLKVTRSAMPLTNSMFVDDLLLMGELSQREVGGTIRVLSDFCSLSGMQLNEAKSKAWFSSGATLQHKETLLQAVQIQEAKEGESYLGCPVQRNGEKPFDYLSIGNDKDFWMWLWKEVAILPKLKVFIWRCCKNAVPVQEMLASRIRSLSPSCKICNTGNESIMHALFHCNFARVAWIASPLGVRTDWFTGGFMETIATMKGMLTKQQFSDFVSMLWAVWRVRNEAVYGGKQQSIVTCMHYYRTMEEAAKLSLGCTLVSTELGQPTGEQPRISTSL